MLITPEYIDPPKNGGKGPWSVKYNNVYYRAWPDMAQQMTVGQTYECVVATEEYNGKPQHNIKSVNVAAGGQAGVPTQEPPPTAKRSVDPTPANIFIQGMMQQAIASGVHDPSAVYWWAVQNYPNFRDRKPCTLFPGVDAGAGGGGGPSSPQELETDVKPPLDDQIPF
jgi:hypothetical protein